MPVYVDDPDTPGAKIDVIELQRRDQVALLPPFLVRHWLRREVWTRREAMKLLAGYDPDSTPWGESDAGFNTIPPGQIGYLDGMTALQLHVAGIGHPRSGDCLSDFWRLADYSKWVSLDEKRCPWDWLAWVADREFEPYWLGWAREQGLFTNGESPKSTSHHAVPPMPVRAASPASQGRMDAGEKYKNRYRAVIEYANGAMFNAAELDAWSASNKLHISFDQLFSETATRDGHDAAHHYVSYEILPDTIAWKLVPDDVDPEDARLQLSAAHDVSSPQNPVARLRDLVMARYDRQLLCAVYDGDLNLYDTLTHTKVDVTAARLGYDENPDAFLQSARDRGIVRLPAAPQSVLNNAGTVPPEEEASSVTNGGEMWTTEAAAPLPEASHSHATDFLSLGQVINFVALSIDVPKGRTSLDDEPMWRTSEAAGKLYERLHNATEARPRWMEIHRTIGKPLANDAVADEGMAILLHAAGWCERETTARARHSLDCVKAGLDPAVVGPAPRDPNGGQWNYSKYWMREHQIGFVRAELSDFLGISLGAATQDERDDVVLDIQGAHERAREAAARIETERWGYLAKPEDMRVTLASWPDQLDALSTGEGISMTTHGWTEFLAREVADRQRWEGPEYEAKFGVVWAEYLNIFVALAGTLPLTYEASGLRWRGMQLPSNWLTTLHLEKGELREWAKSHAPEIAKSRLLAEPNFADLKTPSSITDVVESSVNGVISPATGRPSRLEPDRRKQAIPIESLFTQPGFERNYQRFVAEPGSRPIKTAITGALIAGAKAGETLAVSIRTIKKKGDPWSDAEMRTLLDESRQADFTQKAAGEKYGVAPQRISELLKKAKGKFGSPAKASIFPTVATQGRKVKGNNY